MTDLDHYEKLTTDGEVTVTLTAQEKAVALKLYDFGIKNISDDEINILNQLISKLKDKIWP